MKQKDTKIYKRTVLEYCTAYEAFNIYSKDIEEGKAKIKKAEDKFKELNNIDPDIETWYNFYISMITSSLSIKQRWAKEAHERCNKAKDILIKEYEETDLESLYLKNKL